MKNLLSKKYVSLFVILIIAVILAFKTKTTTEKREEGVGTVVKQDLIQRVTMAGTIVPVRKTVIIAPYNGYVKKLFVKMGDQVKQGDPLVSVVQSLQNGDGSFPLRAPLDGVVVQLGKAEGEFVKEGDPKDFILRIDDNSKYRILSNVPEIDRVKLKTGQEAIIKVSPILDKSYKGIIRELSLAATQKEDFSRSQVAEFPIKIEIVDSDEKIKSGMTVVIDVITNKKEKILMLRHEFIRQDADKYFVILTNGKRKNIKVGIQNEDGFEILAGLNEGEKVKQVDFSELSEVE
jgi:multidrug efflux pump subunit AcrA (membrane-fusion protein)